MNGVLEEVLYYSGTNNQNNKEYTNGSNITFMLSNNVAYWFASYSYLDFLIAFIGREKGESRGQYANLRADPLFTPTGSIYQKPFIEVGPKVGEVNEYGAIRSYGRPVWAARDAELAFTHGADSPKDEQVYNQFVDQYAISDFDSNTLKVARNNKNGQYRSLISPPSVDEIFSGVELMIGTLSIKRITGLPFKNMLARWITSVADTNDENIGLLNPENLYGKGPYMNFPDTPDDQLKKFRLNFMVHTLLNDFGVINSSNTTAPISIIFTVAPPEQMFKPRITQSLLKEVFFRDDVYWQSPTTQVSVNTAEVIFENSILPAYISYTDVSTYCRIFNPKLLLRTMKVPSNSPMPKNIQSQIHKNTSDVFLPAWGFNQEDIKIQTNTNSVKGMFLTLRHVNALTKIVPYGVKITLGSYQFPSVKIPKTANKATLSWDYDHANLVGKMTAIWDAKQIAQDPSNFLVMSHCLDFYPEIPLNVMEFTVNGVIQDPNVPFDYVKSGRDRYEDYFGKTSIDPGTKPAVGNRYCNISPSTSLSIQYETMINSGLDTNVRGSEIGFGIAPPFNQVGFSTNTFSQKGDSYQGETLDTYSLGSSFFVSDLTALKEFEDITDVEQYTMKASGKCFYYRRMMDMPGMPKVWGKYNFARTTPMVRLTPFALKTDIKKYFNDNFVPVFTVIGDQIAQYNNGAIVTTD